MDSHDDVASSIHQTLAAGGQQGQGWHLLDDSSVRPVSRREVGTDGQCPHVIQRIVNPRFLS